MYALVVVYDSSLAFSKSPIKLGSRAKRTFRRTSRCCVAKKKAFEKAKYLYGVQCRRVRNLFAE